MFQEVVVALSSCAKWVTDLMLWLTDGLFSLLDDPNFMELLEDPRRFTEMTSYLKAKNNVSLHFLLCSSTRGLLASILRRFPVLQDICHRAMQHLDRPPSNPAESLSAQGQSLHQAYMRLQQCIITDLVKIDEFEKLLASVSADVRQTYQASLSSLQQQKQQQQQQQQGQPKQGQPNTAEQTVKKAQAHCELSILLADQPPPSFQLLVKKLFETDLKGLMGSTNRSELFFTDFPLLEVDDDPRRLAKRKAEGKYVDVFRRIEYKAPQLVKGTANGGDLMHQQVEQGIRQSGAASVSMRRSFRRCIRCCSVMEEIQATRPGFNFFASLQRKCFCGGSWAALS